MNRYLCYVVGEDKARVDKLLPVTRRRYATFALAVHIPVLLWAVNGFLISQVVFDTSIPVSGVIAAVCGALIFLIERIILATDKSLWVMGLRFVLGLLISSIGAAGMDLVIFDREIQVQLKADSATALDEREQTFQDKDKIRLAAVEKLRLTWLTAQEKAACEGNGTCGSKQKSAGPLYKALKENEKETRQDYDRALAARQKDQEAHDADMVEAKASSMKPHDAGLLSRMKALHTFIQNDSLANLLYWMIFDLLLIMELTVVLVKALSKETPDDLLEKLQAEDRGRQATEYFNSLKHPSYSAEKTVKTALNQSHY